MIVPASLKLSLKRGALVAAANWQVVIVQFIADTLFKSLLAVPIVGGVMLVVLVVGGEPRDLLRLESSQVVPRLVAGLMAQPAALLAFLLALCLVLICGSVLMFAVKAGTVTIIAAGDLAIGPLEEGPLKMSAIDAAEAWSLEAFTEGVRTLFDRYLRLGVGLTLAYVAIAGAYLLMIFASPFGSVFDASLMIALATIVLVVVVTIVNFVYVLLQIVVAVEDCAVYQAIPHVLRLLKHRRRDLLQALAIVVALMAISTAASILATTALGLVAFVPFVGLAALPLQLCAWLVRGVVFQFVGLTGVATYLRVHRDERAKLAEPRLAPDFHPVQTS